MKKILAAVLCGILGIAACFGLTGCGGDDGTLVVYTEAGFAPFEYVENGEIVGVDVDIMNLVGEKLGVKVKFENVNFNTIVDAVSSGKMCDVGAAGLSVTAARKEKVVFSKEYYTAKLYVIYPVADEGTYLKKTNDNSNYGVYWDSLAGKKIAVQDGTTADLFLTDEMGEDWGVLYEQNSTKVGFASLEKALDSSEKDVLIIDELPAKMLIEKKEATYACAPLYYKGADEDDVETTDVDESLDVPAEDVYAIAVCPNQSAKLLNAINEVLDELGEKGIQALVNQHLGLGNAN